jgi:hypothetical protein
MRKQQLALRALGLATALSIGTAFAGDGPAGSPSAARGKPPAGEGRHDHGDHGKPGHAKHDHGAEPRGKDVDKGADKVQGPDKDKGPDKDRGPDKARHGHGPRGLHELWTELKAGKLKKDELKERLSQLRERREERATEHRQELKARFGAVLAAPAARAELEHHARRMAKLNRAMVLAETEVTKDKDKLKERIQKLIDKENARHQQAMDRFRPGTPDAASAAAPAVPPAAVAAEKGAEK